MSALTSLVRPAIWTAFWFCIFFGPLYYILPHVGWNPWWSLLVGTAGATVYIMMAAAVWWADAKDAQA